MNTDALLRDLRLLLDQFGSTQSAGALIEVPLNLIQLCMVTLDSYGKQEADSGRMTQSPSELGEIVKPSAWATRELRYKAVLTDVRSVTERQKGEILALTEELQALRSGEALIALQNRIKELEQQVRSLLIEKSAYTSSDGGQAPPQSALELAGKAEGSRSGGSSLAADAPRVSPRGGTSHSRRPQHPSGRDREGSSPSSSSSSTGAPLGGPVSNVVEERLSVKQAKDAFQKAVDSSAAGARKRVSSETGARKRVSSETGSGGRPIGASTSPGLADRLDPAHMSSSVSAEPEHVSDEDSQQRPSTPSPSDMTRASFGPGAEHTSASPPVADPEEEAHHAAMRPPVAVAELVGAEPGGSAATDLDLDLLGNRPPPVAVADLLGDLFAIQSPEEALAAVAAAPSGSAATDLDLDLLGIASDPSPWTDTFASASAPAVGAVTPEDLLGFEALLGPPAPADCTAASRTPVPEGETREAPVPLGETVSDGSLVPAEGSGYGEQRFEAVWAPPAAAHDGGGGRGGDADRPTMDGPGQPLSVSCGSANAGCEELTDTPLGDDLQQLLEGDGVSIQRLDGSGVSFQQILGGGSEASELTAAASQDSLTQSQTGEGASERPRQCEDEADPAAADALVSGPPSLDPASQVCAEELGANRVMAWDGNMSDRGEGSDCGEGSDRGEGSVSYGKGEGKGKRGEDLEPFGTGGQEERAAETILPLETASPMADEVDAAMLALVAAAAATAHRADRGAQTSAPHSPAASPPPPRAASQEEFDLRSEVNQLASKLSVYEVTLEQLRTTVEEADMKKQLLQEQNMELASRLAEMQAFISHQAQSIKTAKTASVSSFLKGHRGKQQQQK